MFSRNPFARVRLTLSVSAAVVFWAAIGFASKATPSRPAPSVASIHWPEGTEISSFADLDGVILLQATVTGIEGRDTTGAFVLDTGAGYVALDERLAIRLGIAVSPATGEIAFTRSALPRFRLGALTIDQVEAMSFDAEAIRSVIDQPVLGLLGHQPMQDRALWIDYGSKQLALVPAGTADTAASLRASRQVVADFVSPAATGIPFRLAAGGKVLVRARITPRQGSRTDWLTFVFDTGATKCALFSNASDWPDRTANWRPALRALETPTLLGRTPARLVRAAKLEVASSAGDVGSSETFAPGVDVLLVGGPLGQELSRAAGEPVHGLLGYSFLKQFRVVCDYPHRVLWLDPIPGYHDDRPYEHSHAGIQLERQGGVVRVMSVARPSPGMRAGIQPGDEVVAVDRVRSDESSLIELGRRMEGKPGTVFSLTIRRAGRDTAYRIKRERLL